VQQKWWREACLEKCISSCYTTAIGTSFGFRLDSIFCIHSIIVGISSPLEYFKAAHSIAPVSRNHISPIVSAEHRVSRVLSDSDFQPEPSRLTFSTRMPNQSTPSTTEHTQNKSLETKQTKTFGESTFQTPRRATKTNSKHMSPVIPTGRYDECGCRGCW
jgi:hypothetical protein